MTTATYHKIDEIPFNDSKKILVQIFSSVGDIEGLVKQTLEELKTKMPNAEIIGASSQV